MLAAPNDDVLDTAGDVEPATRHIAAIAGIEPLPVEQPARRAGIELRRHLAKLDLRGIWDTVRLQEAFARCQCGDDNAWTPLRRPAASPLA